MTRVPRPIALASLLVLLAGCDSLGESRLPGRSDVLMSELFAAPTAEELGEIEQTTFDMDLPPLGVREEASFPLEGGGTVRILSHLVDGERHVGAIAIPDGTGPLAVTLYRVRAALRVKP